MMRDAKGRSYLNEEFLLDTAEAVELYERFARALPIVDFHNHLSPAMVSEDHRFANLAEAWLDGDHYKWRAMRLAGVPEHAITGGASPREKFDAWAATVPQTIRNPLHHWTHLELWRNLGIHGILLDSRSADGIWHEANDRLAERSRFCVGLLAAQRVELLCTTDDPLDSLEHHGAFAAAGETPFRMRPTFRPDAVLAVENTAAWNGYVDQLSAAAGVRIDSLDDLFAALESRVEHFAAHGCRLSDHALNGVPRVTGAVIGRSGFEAIRNGSIPSAETADALRVELLVFLGGEYRRRGWTQQYHIGALRNPRRVALAALGRDSGIDCMGDAPVVAPTAALLDELESRDALPRTILYNINPRDTAALACLAASFAGTVRPGAPWWFLDQLRGIEAGLDAVSDFFLLPQFPGMVTDSRSFFSFPRHEYFRRILCNVLGREIAAGRLPRDLDGIGEIVERVCYRNAAAMFA